MPGSQIIYIKIEKNVQVHDHTIYLKDIAQVIASEKAVENKVRSIKIPNVIKAGAGRYAMSIMEIIPLINQEYPNAEVENIGEADFIITMEKKKQPGKYISWAKTIFVALTAFFGAAFAIMTFNFDSSVPELFQSLYFQFVGTRSDGFTILEITYSLGIGIGILVFFNHFAKRKANTDPTPMEVEMRLYEDDVDKTIIEASRRNRSKRQGTAS